MKIILATAAIVLTTLFALGTDFPLASAYNTDNQVLTLTAPNTNSIVGTNTIEANKWHTWYFTTTSNLNGVQWSVDFSGDSTNWMVTGTNTVGATANAAVNSWTNYNGRHSYYRVRFNGTNITGKIVYLGGN